MNFLVIIFERLNDFIIVFSSFGERGMIVNAQLAGVCVQTSLLLKVQEALLFVHKSEVFFGSHSPPPNKFPACRLPRVCVTYNALGNGVKARYEKSQPAVQLIDDVADVAEAF